MPPISALRTFVADWPDGDVRFQAVLRCLSEEDIEDTLDLAVMYAGEKLPEDKMRRLLSGADFESCAPVLQYVFELARGGKETALEKEASRIFAAPATMGGIPRSSKRASDRQSLASSRSPCKI